MKKNYLIVIILLVGLSLYAQTPTNATSQFVASESGSGYVNLTEFNFGYGLGGTDIPYSHYCIGVTNISSFQLAFKRDFMEDKILQAGVGTGYFGYNGGGTIPLFADFRFVFAGNQVEPYIYGQGGGLFDTKDLGKDIRMFANGGGGIRYPFNDNLVLNVGLGLMVQVGPFLPRDSYVNLKLGLTFKPGKK